MPFSGEALASPYNAALRDGSLRDGFASPAVAASIAAHLDWLDRQIEAVMDEVRRLIASDPALRQNFALLRGVTGFGEVSAASGETLFRPT